MTFQEQDLYDLKKAKTHLAKEITKSTEDDPLYLCHAGLTEFIYQVVEEVIGSGNKASLNHLYIQKYYLLC